ncbi:DUF4932 domain-containing protein [Oceanirhabdus seepicola]|uniref:DUF4932 domain-containing protein n=1 Tax=Oceanirhabdus seepicola TaxID=2828781 RepID=A0A9J6NYY6_9CLOT|nr:DUF4932 domain-containing protein [Oceanirhabdus seepicola]MCM1989121.1 DUF4932 domain-containing protein [Oceanirhabdus seepicola]
MKKLCIVLLSVMLILVTPKQTYAAIEMQKKNDVPLDKYWTIKLNIDVDESSIIDNNIYILDAQGNKINCELSKTDNTNIITITPKSNYNPGEKYTLHIEKGIKSISGEKLNEAVIMEFTTKKQSNQEMEDRIKEKIIFENDIRTFTLYAFMNFTGYDDENNKSGFHEVRKMVREDLENMNLELLDNDFYTNTDKDYVYYKNTLKKLGSAPDFPPLQKMGKYEIKGIEKHLKEFYEKANIEELYKKYKPYYDKELKKYSDNAIEAIAKTNSFLRVDVPNSESFYIEVNLLDAYWRGFGLGNIDLYRGKGVILTGPSYEPNILNIVHEYLHGVINPIIDDLDKEVNNLSYNMKEIQQSKAVKQGYDNWSEITKESFVRALSRKMVGGYSMNEIERQTSDGFVLTKYVYEEFDKYEDYDGTLKEFIRDILKSYE